MNKLRKTHFYMLQESAENQWHPYTISKFFLVTFLVGLIFTAYPFYNFVIEPKHLNSFTQSLGNIMMIAVVVQILVVLFYFSGERTIKYQKLQAYLLPVFSFKFATDPIIMYWFVCHFYNLNWEFYFLGILLVLTGLGVIVGMFIRNVKKIKNGNLQRNGVGLYKVNSVVNVGSSPLYIGIIIIVSYFIKNISGTNMEMGSMTWLFFIVSAAIYLPITYVIPEFILIAYCKKRFTSFHQMK